MISSCGCLVAKMINSRLHFIGSFFLEALSFSSSSRTTQRSSLFAGKQGAFGRFSVERFLEEINKINARLKRNIASLTIALVVQIREDAHLLRKDKHSEAAALQSRIVNAARVGHQLASIKNLHADQTDARTMRQVPAISGLWLPADILRVHPQQLHLIGRVSGMPQTVAQHFAWSCSAVDQLDLNSRLCVGNERLLVPIFLSVTLPHYRIEAMIALITEDESNVVIIILGINEESSFQVNAIERIVANCQSRIGILGLNNFCAFVEDNPLGIELTDASGIQRNQLKSAEVGIEDSFVVRTSIIAIFMSVTIFIRFAIITDIVFV